MSRNPITPPKRDRPKSISSTRQISSSQHTRALSHTSKTTFNPTTPSLAAGATTTTTTTTPQHLKYDEETIHPFDPDSPLHFSPSKARAAAQASHQLSQLTNWLDEVLSLPPPSTSAPTSQQISRDRPQHQNQNHLISKWTTEHRSLTTTNPDLATSTMKWLQEVMGQNLRSDERNRLLHEAGCEELRNLRTVSGHHDHDDNDKDDEDDEAGEYDEDEDEDETIRELYDHLSPESREALDSLAQTSVLLGAGHETDDHLSSPSSLIKDLGQSVMDHTIRVQDVQDYAESLVRIQKELNDTLDQAERELKRFEGEGGEKVVADRDAEVVLRPQTARWNRETKQISVKIQEYRDRLAALQRSGPGGNAGEGFAKIEHVLQLQDRVQKKRETLKLLQDKIRIMNGLPPDLEASRNEVKRAKAELQRLKSRREELQSTINPSR